jgi:hypothetical protein
MRRDVDWEIVKAYNFISAEDMGKSLRDKGGTMRVGGMGWGVGARRVTVIRTAAGKTVRLN